VILPQTHRPIRTLSLSLFEWTEEPHSLPESIAQSLAALREASADFAHWVIPFSGGKDSGVVVSFVLWAIEKCYVPRPQRLIVLRSDTTYELLDLQHNAEALMSEVRNRGFEAITVGPARNDRFYVTILGRGLPPPHPAYKGRWCTRVLKVKPMKAVIDQVAEDIGCRFLLMSGVRMGESKQRDGKLNDSKRLAAVACSKDSGECGAGGIWMDERMSTNYTALPLIVNWRECHVYDFLQGWFHHEGVKGHGLESLTRPIAWMYGQHEDGLIERSVRFGCFGCPVVKEDRMTAQAAKKNPKLSPILELHGVWEEMRKPEYRLWKPSGTAKGKMGPLTIAARKKFLKVILDIQHRSCVTLITDEDLEAINRCHREKVYPRGWTGEEVLATTRPTGDGRLRFTKAKSPSVKESPDV
jgi:DNA sulfur modification protein DndC